MHLRLELFLCGKRLRRSSHFLEEIMFHTHTQESVHIHTGDESTWHFVEHALEHTLQESVLVILILFLTYLAMEWLEHHTGDKIQSWVQKAGKLGPVIGALVGAVPQCGFSAAASNLYAGRLITMGTLIAIYLSTSDEMLPVMISSQAAPEMIGGVLLAKILIGMAAGFAIDLFTRNKKDAHEHIHEVCQEEQCHCEKGIFRSVLKHTVQVGLFILLISFGLNLALEIVGEDVLAGILLNQPILGPVLAGLVGLIPNCAASVVITELFMSGVIGMGTMLAGLLVGAGVGLLVLFRVNHRRWENLKIVGLLYSIGVLVGIVIELIAV